jgi:Ni,Fe-hydrogenase I large subunit
MAKVVIDPITRIEGHLRVTCKVEGGKVVDAWNSATLFRGFEVFMRNRHPDDCWHFAQRICGVCPNPHAHNSVLACERAMGVEKVPDNARLVRNMLDATQLGYDCILWFYTLNAFDYVNVPNALNAKPTTPTGKALAETLKTFVASGQLGPFANMYWDNPGYKLPADLDLELTGHYLASFAAMGSANKACAYLAGKFPMIMTLTPGGIMSMPTLDQIAYYRARMLEVQEFTNTVMLPDLIAIAPYYLDLAKTGKGTGNYLTWGVLDGESQKMNDRVFPAGGIANGELKVFDVDTANTHMFAKYSFYEDSVGGGKIPLDSYQQPIQYNPAGLPPLDSDKFPEGKYDWTRAARYEHGGKMLPMEVGPLAEVLVGYLRGQKDIVAVVDQVLAAVGATGHPEVLLSNLGRIAARVVKAVVNANTALTWADALEANIKKGDNICYTAPPHPQEGIGAGGWDAPRGALCHYVEIKNGLTTRYAAVPASNWNLSPRDDAGVRGPVEEALIGTPVHDVAQPLEILRVVHTFDP